MNRPSRIADLAARAERGDERARRQLLQALAPALARLAKAAVQPQRPGSPATPLIQRVQAIAERVTEGNPAACDPAALAHDLGRLVAARLCPSPTEVAAATLLSA